MRPNTNKHNKKRDLPRAKRTVAQDEKKRRQDLENGTKSNDIVPYRNGTLLHGTIPLGFVPFSGPCIRHVSYDSYTTYVTYIERH